MTWHSAPSGSSIQTTQKPFQTNWVLRMSWGLKPICAYTEVEANVFSTDVYKLADECIPHAACPVPAGMIKAVEVASDMGVKRDVSIKIE